MNLQLLGFNSYQLDNDNLIDRNDVFSACDYIIESVKKTEFVNKHESIGYGLTDNVLKVMAVESPQGTITYSRLAQLFHHVSELELVSTLKDLQEKEILGKISKGNYYMKDQLFLRFLHKYYVTLG